MNDCQQPCRFIFAIWKKKQNNFGNRQQTSKDRQRLAKSKFGAKSSNLNEDCERPLTTMKDCQQH